MDKRREESVPSTENHEQRRSTSLSWLDIYSVFGVEYFIMHSSYSSTAVPASRLLGSIRMYLWSTVTPAIHRTIIISCHLNYLCNSRGKPNLRPTFVALVLWAGLENNTQEQKSSYIGVKRKTYEYFVVHKKARRGYIK